MVSLQKRFKTSMLQLDLCDYSDADIVAKETINVTDLKIHMMRNWLLNIMHYSVAAFQKLITH